MLNINGISINGNEKARKKLLKRFSPMDGIGHDLRGITDYEEAMAKARLDYTVEKKELYLADGTKIKDNFANIINKSPSMLKDEANEDLIFGTTIERDNTLGIVGKDYTILNNMESFRVAEEIVKEGAGSYEIGGPAIGAKRTKDYAKSFLILRHDDFQIFDDSYNSFTIFNNSFDGSSGFQAYFANLRLVCMNGFVRYLAHMDKQAVPKFYIQHSRSAEERLKTVSEALAKQRYYIETLVKEAEVLRANGFTKKEYEKEIIPMVLKEMKLIKDNKKEEGEERQRGENKIEETITRLVAAYEADDTQNYNNTVYKVLLTMTDFESHAEPLRDTNNPSIYFNRMLQGMVLTNTAVNYIIKSRNIKF